MKKLSKTTIEEYIYNTEDTRNYHVQEMIVDGWEEHGQSKKKDENREWQWYAKFYKYE